MCHRWESNPGPKVIKVSWTMDMCHRWESDPGPEVIKLFPCSAQLSMKIFLLINVKMLTYVGILTFMSGKIIILGLSEHKKAEFFDIFILMSI